MNCDGEFIKEYFTELEKADIKYCILRNAEEVEAGDAHDVDMTVELSSMSQAFDIMDQTAVRLGWKMHMMTGTKKDPVNIKCMNFFKIVDGKPILVHIDFFPTCTWQGMVLLDNQAMIDQIDTTNIYHRANCGIEAVTKLFIRLLHNNYIKEKYIPSIFAAFTNNEEQMLNVMSNFLSNSKAKWICEKVHNQEWSEIEKCRSEIVADIQCTLKHKKNYYAVKANYYVYLMRKFLKKAAPMVVFEGTDGSGKTTIIDALPQVLERTFNENLIDYYHWRPNFVKSPNAKSNENTGEVCTEPHAQKPYNKFISFAKFMYFNLDYILGYYLKCRIQQCKGRMVIFDRYYYDYYMDKLRYRLNISDTVLNLFKCFIPKPDITFLLVGNAETIYQRKKEIPLEEIQAQISTLTDNQNNFHNAYIIDVCRSIDDIVNDVSAKILECNSIKYWKGIKK